MELRPILLLPHPHLSRSHPQAQHPSIKLESAHNLEYDDLQVEEHDVLSLARLEVTLFLLTECINEYVNQFLSVTEKLATCARRRVSSTFNSYISLPYQVHHPIGSLCAKTVLSKLVCGLVKFGTQRLVKSRNYPQRLKAS